MRVLYHHRTQGRSVEAVHILGLCEGLRELGCRVEITGPPGVEVRSGGDGPSPPGRYSQLARHLPQAAFEVLEMAYTVAALPRLVRSLRALRPAFLYERYALYNLAGLLAGRLTGTPLILEINETVASDRERYGKRLMLRPLARWFERRLFRGAAGVVAVSERLRQQAIAAGAAPERVIVTPNAVDPAEFDPAERDGTQLRTQFEWRDCTVIGFAGSFARWHRCDLLVRAFAQLAPEFPQVRLMLVGDGGNRSAVEALARELGVGSRTVCTGRVPHSAMPDYIGAMDVAVMPASNDFGSPMKVFEYLAMGRPTVAPRLGPLEEAITDGESGRLFEAGSVESLTGCLRELLRDPAGAARMGAAGRRKVTEQHRWVCNARRVVSLIPANGVAAPRRPSPVR